MKKRIFARIIEALLLLAGILLAAAIVVAIPLKSYNEYADYLERLIELSKPEPKPVLESITVSLKEGVQYFKNDLAEPKAEDFVVIANYTLEGKPYSEEVGAAQFKFTAENDFYAVGGDIKFTFKNQSTVLHVDLIPVKMETLRITQNPYTVKYQTGSTFDMEGLIISAVYNDGSTKVISAEKYVVDTSRVLSPADKAVSVKYTEGEETYTLDVPIGVVDVLDNGAVTKLILASDAIVQSGSKLSDTQMEINAVYESGNRLPLDKSQYLVSGGNTVAKLGKAYTVTVSYAQNTSISLSTDVIVRTKVEGEDGIIVGGGRNKEVEFAVIDGVITNLGNSVSFAGGFGGTVLNGGEGSLTVTINSESAIVGDLTMRCGNSYCCFVNGSNKNDGYRMLPLQINTILDLTVNGKEITIPDNVVLRGTDIHKDYAPLYGIYYEFTFEDIALEPGANTIKVRFKPSTAGAINCWGESPSTMNIDYVNFDAKGNDIPDNYTIDQIELSPNYTVAVGGKISDIKPPVIATLANGTKILVPSELFDFSVSGGEAGATYTKYGKYTVTATLKSNPAVKATRDVEFEGIKVLKAGVELDGDKVYYVFSGEAYGYVAEDLVFFDNATMYDIDAEFTENAFTFKIDVTLLTPGVIIYPHLRVKGNVYYNGGANNNGDIRGMGLTFTNNQSVTYNGQIYKIVEDYSMPTLRVTAAN